MQGRWWGKKKVNKHKLPVRSSSHARAWWLCLGSFPLMVEESCRRNLSLPSTQGVSKLRKSLPNLVDIWCRCRKGIPLRNTRLLLSHNKTYDSYGIVGVNYCVDDGISSPAYLFRKMKRHLSINSIMRTFLYVLLQNWLNIPRLSEG